MPGLGVIGHAHFLHRAWRYRLRTERRELAYLLSLDLRGRTCVDIGAHRGVFSYWMCRAVGPGGRVVAFEPQPEMVRELKDFRASFRAKNLSVVESGLSSRTGTATLRRLGSHTGGASVEHADRPDATCFKIAVTTLDDHFAEHPAGSVAFIKCDVEGHERAVFRGARRVLGEDRPRLLFECHDEHARDGGVFDDLRSLGYRGWFLDGARRVPVERFDAERPGIDRPYLNYIFEPV